MKIYISADIEGIAGIAHWDETSKKTSDYSEFQQRMTRHVGAACEAALEAGATEILVNDAHDTGRNILHEELPESVSLVRGWSDHPLFMVQELDESFAAVALIGYHARAGSGANPLAHTLSGSRFAEIRLNGQAVAEMHLYAYASAMLGVPVAFVSGDEEVCSDARTLNPNMVTVPALRGVGDSTIAVHPSLVERELRAGMARAISGDLKRHCLHLPEHFRLELDYKQPAHAYRASFFPGMEQIGTRTLVLETSAYFEILRALAFLI